MERLAKQELISNEVRRHMDTFDLTQDDIARVLGVQQPAIWKKLAGLRRWSLDDIERLEAFGVPIAVRPLYLGEEVGA